MTTVSVSDRGSVRATPSVPRLLRAVPRPAATRPARVSVIIPCYNYGHFLPCAIESALNQNDVDVEVIVVDDASSDASAAVAAEYAKYDRRVSVEVNTRNLGPVVTFNRGLLRASGEFIIRLDADDALSPNSIVRAVAVAQAFPGVGLVYGHPVHFESEPLPTSRQQVRSWLIWPGRQWLELRCRATTNVITSPEVLMRASVVARVGGQKPLSHTHDMEMWLRMAAFSDVAYIVGADQALHREHSASLSAREVDRLVDLKERRDAFHTLFSGIAGEIPEAPSLSRIAIKNVARQSLKIAIHELDRGRAEESWVEALQEFARGCDATVGLTREWRRLRRRRRLGSGAVARRPWYVAQAALRGVCTRARYWSWCRTGVYEFTALALPVHSLGSGLIKRRRDTSTTSTSQSMPIRSVNAPS